MKIFLISILLFTSIVTLHNKKVFTFFVNLKQEVKDIVHKVPQEVSTLMHKLNHSVNKFINDKVEKLKEIINKHQQLQKLHLEVQGLKTTIETQRAQLNQATGFKGSLNELKEKEDKLIDLLTNYQRNFQITNMQQQKSDVTVEKFVDEIININKDVSLVSTQDLEQVDENIETASTTQVRIEDHTQQMDKKLEDLNEKVKDVPDLVANIEKHIDSDSDESKAAIESSMDKLNHINQAILDPGLDELEKTHEEVQQLTSQQYENLRNLKIVEDQVNNRQNQRFDRSKDLLARIKQAEGSGTIDPTLSSVKSIVESLTEAYQ